MSGLRVLARVLVNLRIGLRALLRRPVRTLLVLQGIIWGVAVAVMPPAILEGSRRAAIERAAAMGTDRITLRPQPTAPDPRLDVEDLAAVRAEFATVLEAGAGYSGRRVELRKPWGASVPVDLIGAVGDVLAARGQELARGRMPTEEEWAGGAPVALLEPRAARALFGDEDPLDRTLRIPGPPAREVRIVGLVAPRDPVALRTDDIGLDRDHPLATWAEGALQAWGMQSVDEPWRRSELGVLVPIDLMPVERPGTLDRIILRARPDRAPAESAAIERFLAGRGRDVAVGINMVWPLLASGQIDRYLALNKALFLACLVMGGVVIANLMLLSTIERTREIAIRRTEGATRSDIAWQFLAEALLMGLVGTALGIPLGLGLARARIALEPFTMVVVIVPWREALVSGALAVGTALVAGLLPAWRAARLDPAEALRCE